MSFCSQICTTVRNRQMANNSPDPNRVGQMKFGKRNNILQNYFFVYTRVAVLVTAFEELTMLKLFDICLD